MLPGNIRSFPLGIEVFRLEIRGFPPEIGYVPLESKRKYNNMNGIQRSCFWNVLREFWSEDKVKAWYEFIKVSPLLPIAAMY